ncbi:IS110 family transposase [Aggregatibacter actinomycetemcomitans]|uniref:IS110 family transposase n=1 Tax=Aggregatibacter actinomycetemcomitans TaxID=714 RepID=UPI00197B517E|nr:IS110 family transposase [Aggregatibacter actinomycetemcomitans]MBN6081677.1 IS110 family transposase [Aggregatibacter actinomycetemcomitans]MBN6082061.1 IS110 family transposase [Aggregatibacter actinomycetemcomitans]
MNVSHFIGIDVAKKKFDVAYLKDKERQTVKTKVLDNKPEGFHQLIEWIKKNVGNDFSTIHITLEPTGVYHEALACFLYDHGFIVNLINPARLPKFAAYKGVVHKNDHGDSKLLALFGAENPQEYWQPKPLSIRQLKAKLARLEALKGDLLRENNRLEQAEAGNVPNEVMCSIHHIRNALQEAIVALRKDIDDHINRNPELKSDRELLRSIPGVGENTANQMLVIYHSKMFKKASEMAAFLGLIPRERTSGTMRGKVMLSKKGSPKIRALLFFPAVVATTYNPDIKAHYDRLRERGKTKMQAVGAAMRRLVHICFGVLKNKTFYQPQVCLA